MNILICDDEPVLAEHVGELVRAALTERGVPCTVRRCTTPEAFRAACREDRPQLVLLDLLLGEADGYALAEECRRERMDCELAFITGHPEYMPEAFPFRPIGFLTKPFGSAEVQQLIDRFLFYRNAAGVYRYEVRGFVRDIPINDILYFESSGRHITLYIEGEAEPLRQVAQLSVVEQSLPPSAFLRIHKSFLVNVRRISQLDTSHMRVRLESGRELPISRTHYAETVRRIVSEKTR